MHCCFRNSRLDGLPQDAPYEGYGDVLGIAHSRREMGVLPSGCLLRICIRAIEAFKHFTLQIK